MNPADFVSLAIKLSNSAHEAELRTAVGRAYYGAFHCARQLLEACGVGFPRTELFGADIHRKVRFCLANGGTPHAELVATNLNALRRQRNFADYDLETARFSADNAANVRTYMRMCIEVVDALQQCQSEPTFNHLRQRVRDYARDVLRLPIRDD